MCCNLLQMGFFAMICCYGLVALLLVYNHMHPIILLLFLNMDHLLFSIVHTFFKYRHAVPSL